MCLFFYVFWCMCYSVPLFLVGNSSVIDCMERLVSKMMCYVWSLNTQLNSTVTTVHTSVTGTIQSHREHLPTLLRCVFWTNEKSTQSSVCGLYHRHIHTFFTTTRTSRTHQLCHSNQHLLVCLHSHEKRVQSARLKHQIQYKHINQYPLHQLLFYIIIHE